MKQLLILTFFFTLLFFNYNAQAQESGWKVDTAHSSIGFTVRHLGISKVNGVFHKYSYKINADAKTGKLKYVEGTVEVKSIDTGINARDNHLKSEDFFNTDKFKQTKLKTNKIVINGDVLSGTAELTIKGITKTVKFTGEFLGQHVVDFGGGKSLRAGYSITAKINRKDFGLNFNKLVEGISVVSDTVTIKLETEIYKAVK